MSTQTLGINITSNVNNALPGINRVTVAINRMDGGVDEVSVSLNRLNNNTRTAGTGLRNLGNTTNNVGNSFSSLAKLVAGAFTVDALISFGRNVVDVTAKYESFQAVLTNTLGAREAAKAFQQIQDYAAATPFQVDEITSSFIKLVNRGFKPTTAQLTSIGDLAASQGKSFDQLTEAILDAQSGEFERLKEFGIVARQSNNNVTLSFRDQTVVVEKNSKAVRDTILAFGQLNGIAGSTAAVSKTLGGSISNLSDEWDRFLNIIGKKTAPILTATFKNLSNLISASGKALSENSKQTLEDQVRNNTKTKAAIENFSKLNKQQREAIIAAKEKSLDPLYDIVAKELIPRQERYDEITALLKKSFLGDVKLTDEAKRISSALPALLKTQQILRVNQTLLDEIKAVNDEINKGSAADTGQAFGTASAGSSKDVKTLSDVISELDKKLLQLDVTFAATGGSLQQLSEDKIRAISDALKDMVEFGVLPGTKVFDTYKSRIQQLQDTLNKTPVTIKPVVTIDPIPAATNDAAIAGIAEGFGMSFERYMTDLDLAGTIRDNLGDAIASVSEGLGNVFKKGGGLQDVLAPLVDSLANFGNALGKQLIAQGLSIEAFKASLKSFQGVGAIAAGAALIAASSAFKALATRGISSFATGGAVFGPQMALIGDNPGREEYIIPSEVLDKMGGTSQGTLMTKLSVNELIIWLDRGRRNV